MKRRDLVRVLLDRGYKLARSTGPHDIFQKGAKSIPVPRHTEINENLARKILRDAT